MKNKSSLSISPNKSKPLEHERQFGKGEYSFLSVRISHEVQRKLDELRRTLGISKQKMVEQALSKFLIENGMKPYDARII